MPRVNTKVMGDESTILRIRNGARSFAEFELERGDHLPVIRKLLAIVLDNDVDEVDYVMNYVQAHAKEEFVV